MPRKVKKAVISEEELPSYQDAFISDSEPEVVLLADRDTDEESDLVDSGEETDSDYYRAEAKGNFLVDDECEKYVFRLPFFCVVSPGV